jgi:GDP-L-fucose synthase
MDRQAKILLDPYQIARDSKIYVAGHLGMVGSALLRAARKRGYENLVYAPSDQLDLRDGDRVMDFLKTEKPAVIFMAAAKVGGIEANRLHSAEFLSHNLAIQLNILNAAHIAQVPRLVFLGSSCIYPRLSAQPMSESSLMTGPLEPTNAGYALAKIAGLYQVAAMRRQFGHKWISVVPTNLYGPGDNYSPERSHVLPSLIRRYELAKSAGSRLVWNWGTGRPRRELMHVDDFADACFFLLNSYDEDEHINVGTGKDHTISELANLVSEAIGYEGETNWDQEKPDGSPQKLLDVSRLNALGWTSKISIDVGIKDSISDFRFRFSELVHQKTNTRRFNHD